MSRAVLDHKLPRATFWFHGQLYSKFFIIFILKVLLSAKTNTQRNRQTDKHTNFETLLCSEKKRSSRQIFFIVKFSGVLSSRVKTRFVSKLISSASLHCRAHTGPKTGEHSWALVNNRETRTLEILNLSVGKYCHSHHILTGCWSSLCLKK